MSDIAVLGAFSARGKGNEEPQVRQLNSTDHIEQYNRKKKQRLNKPRPGGDGGNETRVTATSTVSRRMSNSRNWGVFGGTPGSADG